MRPELVAEITYLGWTDEPLLRHTVFVGLREDKPAREVRREVDDQTVKLSSCARNGAAISSEVALDLRTDRSKIGDY